MSIEAVVPTQLAEAAQVLCAAAFGADPARTDLPCAKSAVESWHRAVALGGQGHYARAHTELDRVAVLPGGDPVLRSLAANTRASWWRQLGWHRRAASWDGAALRLAGCGLAGSGLAERGRHAECDALVGLAADALGQRRLPLAARLLERGRPDEAVGDFDETVGDFDETVGDFHALRVRIRWHWVAAEIAMAGGDAPAAVAAAQRSVELAAVGPSTRHRVKSDLVRAAAGVVAGDSSAVGAVARVHQRCVVCGLLPLQWAAALLWAGVADGAQRRSALADAQDCATELARRGGRPRAG
ncbi:MAG TPA: hypothetical protein VIW24_19815 [Aldersonia sp.]